MDAEKGIKYKAVDKKEVVDAGFKRAFGVLILVVSVFALGIMIGRVFPALSGSNSNAFSNFLPASIISKISGEDRDELKNVDTDLYWKVWQTLKDQYVDEETINERDMFYGSIRGMVSSFNDPATIFLDPDETQSFNEGNAGKFFSGIGAELGYENNQVIVVSPLEGSPAEAAGIRPGDIILKVDGEDIKPGDTLFDVVANIRGEEGTKVTLTVFHEGASETEDVEITRGQITVPSMDFETTENEDIVLMDISRFTDATPEEWQNNWDELVKQVIESGAEGVIIDLRSNPGGFFSSAVFAAGEFMPKGTVVAMQEDRRGKTQDYKVSSAGDLQDIEVVVLVDEGSASASEILAGALQKNGRATVVGEKTFGKGTAQDVIDFSDGSSLHITVLKWLLPDGEWINRDNPITPDVEVELDSEDFQAGEDPQLDRAVKILEDAIN